MKTKSIIILVSIGCIVLAAGCAGNNKVHVNKKIQAMSDRELSNHYKMLEMQLDDIDRARELSMEQKYDTHNNPYPDKQKNQLGHLHIADNWGGLKKEKELTLIEMRKRGISPP